EIEFRWKKATCRCDEPMVWPGDPRPFVMARKTIGIIQERREALIRNRRGANEGRWNADRGRRGRALCRPCALRRSCPYGLCAGNAVRLFLLLKGTAWITKCEGWHLMKRIVLRLLIDLEWQRDLFLWMPFLS